MSDNNFKKQIEKELNDTLYRLNETVLSGSEKDVQDMIFYRETLSAVLEHTGAID